MPEVLTTLFRLDPCEDVEYVVVSNLPEDDSFEAETCVFAAHPDGSLNVQYYMNFGTIMDLPGDVPAADVLALLGYELAPVAVQ
jgi:hypothetical protein